MTTMTNIPTTPTTSADDQIYKLTIFLTPAQWDVLSLWSAQLHPKQSPWLHLEHRHDAANEYAIRKNEILEADKGEITIIYTTGSSDDDGAGR